MPTLSFSCPKCNKLFERIKPEMVGHKVRCKCGFVFRLGSKSDKQAWVVDELKRKKALKTTQPPTPSGTGKPSPTAVKKASVFDLSPNQPFPPGESEPVLDAIPVAREPDQKAHPAVTIVSNEDGSEPVLDAIPISNGGPNDPIDAVAVDPIPMELLSEQAAPFADELGGFTAADPFANHHSPQLLSPIPVGAPVQRNPTTYRKRKRRPSSPGSPAGSVWSLILCIIGLPVIAVLMLSYLRNALIAFQLLQSIDKMAGGGMLGQLPGSNPMGSGVTTGLIVALILGVLMGILAMAMIANIIVAILELSQGIEIKWASRVSGIVASIVVVALFMTFAWQVFNLFALINNMEALGRQVGRTIDKSKIGQGILGLAFRHALFAIVPIAVAITGFARSIKR